LQHTDPVEARFGGDLIDGFDPLFSSIDRLKDCEALSSMPEDLDRVRNLVRWT
jgi:hypothetical protein